MSISFSPLVRLVYPEDRVVTSDWIICRWHDAVANGEVADRPGESEPTLAEAIFDLEDIGQITVGKI